MIENNHFHVLLLVENVSDQLAEYLDKKRGYRVYTPISSQEASFNKIRVWNKDEAKWNNLKSPAPSYDIAVMDQSYWNNSGSEQEELSDATPWLNYLKETFPEMGFIFFIDDEETLALKARYKGAKRYLTEKSKKNSELISDTIQLLAVEQAIQQIAQQLTRYQEGILKSLCQMMVKIFCVDHSGIVLFEPDYISGVAIAEYPDRPKEVSKTRSFGSRIPVRNVPAEQELVHSRRPLVITNVECYPGLGPVKEILWDIFGIRRSLILPITGRNRNVIASISLDIYQTNSTYFVQDRDFEEFCERIQPMCERFVEHFAVPVEYYLLQKALSEIAKVVAAPLLNKLEVAEPLNKIVKIAARFLWTKSGGIYRLYQYENHDFLTVVADPDHPELVGQFLPSDIGMAGKLISNPNATFDKTENYIPTQYDELDSESNFGSVLMVKLEWHGVVLGVLYVDDEVGRDFSVQEAEQLQLVAQQAASVIATVTQTRKLHAINSLMQAINKKYKPHDVMNVIASEIALHVRCSHCTFFTKEGDEAEAVMIPQIACGLGAHRIMTQRFPLIPGRKGLVGRVYESRQPILTGNASQESEFVQGRHNSEQIRSMILVPVILRNELEPKNERILGVISVDIEEHNAFNQGDLDLVTAIADQAAPVLERAYILTSLQATSERIISRNNIKDTLRQIVTDAVELSHALSGVIYLLVHDGDKLRWKEKVEYPHDSNLPDPRLESPHSNTRLIVETRKIRFVNNIKQGDPKVHEHLFERGIRSMIGIPLKHEDRVIGVLYLNDRNADREYNEVELFSLEALAGQAAIAIRNTDLYEEMRSGQEQISALYEASEILTSSQNETYILQTIVKAVYSAAKCHSVRIILFKQSNGGTPEAIEPPIVYGATNQFPTNKIVRKDGRSIEVFQTGNYVKIENVDEEREKNPTWVNENMIKEGIRSALCLPLSHQGKTKRIGVMWIQYTAPHTFIQREIDALQLYANQAAFAYDSARRVHELEEGLRGVTESLASNIKADYEDTRRQARNNFAVGLFFASLGALFIFATLMSYAGISLTIGGAVIEAIGALFFRRTDVANKRMDKYHKELFEVRGLEQLLAAADKLTSEQKEDLKREIIDKAKRRWLEDIPLEKTDE